ncbi:hypothetical protein ARAF_0493 [Arsenophonus endosymbiont of Aleurodicus floccissimus]|uniref:hypothetical protein n=1 Tax=Arsenophonus endosymbiont of Aleurodicus floccissimus TaxID=2152761 RepID=UPI000EC5441F|nr:hypothetical protein [Arsenophonus endosymbiont of Aleurodicus floccissimus]SPP31369.1 hypothetical protein ARAF_0493 [Arsenophonus endosymbiont of Aleurodicus floccissimus]
MSGSVFKVPILSRMEIRNFTDTIKQKVRISGLYFPVMEILEFAMPKIEEGFILEIRTIFEMKNNHGLIIPSEKKTFFGKMFIMER